MNAIQLDFFKSAEQCEIDFLRLKVSKLENSTEKVRKGMYAKLNEHGKYILDLQNRLENVERGICRGAFSND